MELSCSLSILYISHLHSVYMHIPSGLTSVEAVTNAILGPSSRDTMSALIPLISDILARLAVLPASSAQVERVFSSMKRIKTAQRNCLNTATLDKLIRVSMEGPKVEEWDPFPALRLWERCNWGNRKIETSNTAICLISPCI